MSSDNKKKEASSGIKNDKEINSAVKKFSIYLIGLTILAVCVFSTFMKTASVEVDKILAKTQEYDQIQMKQVALTESMDTLYYYSSLLNNEKQINTSLLFNVISERKNSFLIQASLLPDKDCRLYKRLGEQINTFMSVKDSIHIASREVDLIRNDLVRCISDNRQAAKKLAIGNMTIN